MKILICIDDTDNMESIGSGELLQIMGGKIKEKKLGMPSFITRHQLLVHEDIPYTSHNSSMCMEMEINDAKYKEIKELTESFLKENHAEGSDPGLCIVKKEKLNKNAIEKLVTFGKSAKKEILAKENAYSLAKELKFAVELSEHGGTGQGVIGALAGCGLRLSGNDGRLKGKIYPENAGNKMSVAHIIKYYPFDEVRIIGGKILNSKEQIIIGSELKGVFLDNKVVLLVKSDENQEIITCNKKELKSY